MFTHGPNQLEASCFTNLLTKPKEYAKGGCPEKKKKKGLAAMTIAADCEKLGIRRLSMYQEALKGSPEG